MGWDEGSFLEGAIAGGITGAGVGIASSVPTAGAIAPISIPIISAIGAVLGALIKSPLFIVFSGILAASFLFGVPIWAVLIIGFLGYIFFFAGGKRRR